MHQHETKFCKTNFLVDQFFISFFLLCEIFLIANTAAQMLNKLTRSKATSGLLFSSKQNAAAVFQNNASATFEMCNTQTRQMKQRKIRVPWRNPLTMIDEYKKSMQAIPRLEDVDVFQPVEIRNVIADANIKEIEDIRKAKKNIGTSNCKSHMQFNLLKIYFLLRGDQVMNCLLKNQLSKNGLIG